MVTRKTIIATFAVILFFSGCSTKYFGIGDDEFKCKGGGDDGVCAGVETVYKNRYLLDKLGSDRSLKKTQEETISINIDNQEQLGDIARPVRIGEQIQRIYIDPYTDKAGNYAQGRFLFKVVKEGKWVLPDGSFLSEDKR